MKIPATLDEMRARGAELVKEAGELEAQIKSSSATADAHEFRAKRHPIATFGDTVNAQQAIVEAQLERMRGLMLTARLESIQRESAYLERDMQRLSRGN